MARYFRFPWSNAGDRATIPDETQSDGAVSYNQGFGPDYQRNPATDPSARRIERQMYNQALFDVTSTLQEYYQTGTPEFITSAANGGTAFPYPQYAKVRFNPGSGERVYESLIANNTNLPTVTTAWRMADFSGLDDLYGLGSTTPLRTGTADGNIPLIGIPGTTANNNNAAVVVRQGSNTNGNFMVYSHGFIMQWGTVVLSGVGNPGNFTAVITYPIAFRFIPTFISTQAAGGTIANSVFSVFSANGLTTSNIHGTNTRNDQGLSVLWVFGGF